MNILIYGSRGWIGSQFKEILENQNIKDSVRNVLYEYKNSILG